MGAFLPAKTVSALADRWYCRLDFPHGRLRAERLRQLAVKAAGDVKDVLPAFAGFRLRMTAVSEYGKIRHITAFQ